MTMQHTPGPWRVDEFIFSAHTGQRIADPFCEDQDIPDVELAANAHLIAAAPDLLRALIDLKALLAAPNKNLPHYHSQCESAIRDANAAIAKAEGRV